MVYIPTCHFKLPLHWAVHHFHTFHLHINTHLCLIVTLWAHKVALGAGIQENRAPHLVLLLPPANILLCFMPVSQLRVGYSGTLFPHRPLRFLGQKHRVRAGHHYSGVRGASELHSHLVNCRKPNTFSSSCLLMVITQHCHTQSPPE